MKIEKTLVFTKPGNFEEHLKIFTCFEGLLKGNLLKEDFTKTILVYVNPVPEELIKEHYENISKLPIYEPTIRAFLESKEGIVLRVYEGVNIIARGRRANGHTDPQKAEKGTVRQIFSNDSLKSAWDEVRYLNNVFHASSSVSGSARERRVWRPYLILE